MARLTKEQCLNKINTLSDKFAVIEERYHKRLLSAEKNRDRELKKVPYPMYNPVLGTMTDVTEDTVNHWYKMDLELALMNYSDAMKRNEYELNKVKENLDKILIKENEKATQEELSTPIPELVDTLKHMFDRWAEEEIKKNDEHPYYSKLTEAQRMEYLVMPIAREITYRSYGVIGKIHHFSPIDFRYGKVDIVTYNERGSSCTLFSTIVNGHERTSCYGKVYEVKPHIRTITI